MAIPMRVKATEPLGEGAVIVDDLVIMLIMTVSVVVDVRFVEISKFRTGFGAGIDFLDPSRVESIDKRLILCLETTTNR